MNLILLQPGELCHGQVTLRGRRARHILEVLRAGPGTTLRVGERDGRIGSGRVVEAAQDAVTLMVNLEHEAEPPWIDLLLALPRPKVLKRLWAQLAALGVRRIMLTNAARVERCYFDTHWLAPENYTPLLLEGLEQSGTTALPQISIHRRFKPLVEDELPPAYAGALKLVAHPGITREAEAKIPAMVAAARGAMPLLAVGPEGGWSSYELQLLATCGFSPVALGRRVLRSDTAVIALLGRLGLIDL